MSILLAAPSDIVNDIVNTFNSFHPRLQFTLEVGGDSLNFLDVTIVKLNGDLEFDWFHKPTFSGRYLNYNSQHALSQKKGTIIGMVDRTFILSHPKYHQKNLNLIIEILRLNDYPLKLIFDTINTRLKYLISEHTRIHSNSRVTNTQSRWFTVPFISSLSHKFRNVTKDLEASISYYSMNKLSNIIRPQKDPLPKQHHRNVVYKISCKDCDASYVGQTGRKIMTRVKEHKNHIRRSTTTHSVITDHRLNDNHEFDWDNVEILDNERYLSKRLISEMLHITRQKNSLNLQSDTEFLHHAWVSVLGKL